MLDGEIEGEFPRLKKNNKNQYYINVAKNVSGY